MRRRGVLLTIVGPWRRAVIPAIVRNEAVVLGNGLSLRFPEPDVREGAMHEDDRSACPLFDVGRLHAVDTQLARLRWGFRARLQGEATTHRDDDRKPEAREPGHDRLLPLVSVRAPNVTYQPRRALCAVGCMRLLGGRPRHLLATTLPYEDFAIFGGSSLNVSEPVPGGTHAIERKNARATLWSIRRIRDFRVLLALALLEQGIRQAPSLNPLLRFGKRHPYGKVTMKLFNSCLGLTLERRATAR